jgi:hypothetical protein
MGRGSVSLTFFGEVMGKLRLSNKKYREIHRRGRKISLGDTKLRINLALVEVRENRKRTTHHTTEMRGRAWPHHNFDYFENKAWRCDLIPQSFAVSNNNTLYTTIMGNSPPSSRRRPTEEGAAAADIPLHASSSSSRPCQSHVYI